MRLSAEFSSGWKVLFAAFIGNALSAGTLAVHSLGILGPALGGDFHWGAGIVTGGLLVLSLATVATAPLAGLFADRFGVRTVALISTLLLAPAYMGFAFLSASIPAYFCLWLVPTPRAAARVVTTIGLTLGMEADVAAFLVARYFGARRFDSIYGCIYGAFAVRTGLGALGYGMAFDRFADYHAALLSSGLILTVSGALLLTLGRYIFPVTPARVRST